MPDDTFLNLRNERNQHNPLVAQAVNQISLIPTAKSLFIDETNCGTIFRIFTAHDDDVVVYAHRVDIVLWIFRLLEKRFWILAPLNFRVVGNPETEMPVN
jgi:hypothetical protein